MKIPSIFVPEKNLEDKTKKLLKEPMKFQPGYTKFKVICAGTYIESIAMLKEQGRKPFTFSENIEARIADYKTNDEGAVLFKTYLDSVTGIAHKANSDKFKIILRSDKLEDTTPRFNQRFMPVDYDAEQGIEFDRTKGKYNQSLMREEAKNHEFWLAITNGDKEKLEEYVDIWFDKTKAEKGMGVYLRGGVGHGKLWALVLGSDGGSSCVVDYYDLYLCTRFVFVG